MRNIGGNVIPRAFAVLRLRHQLELRGLLDWQVARLRPFQDLVDKDGGAWPHLENIRGIGNEASRLGVGSYPTDGRQPVRAPANSRIRWRCALNMALSVTISAPAPAASDRAEGLVECPSIAHLDAALQADYPEGLGLHRDVPWHAVVGAVSRMDEDGHLGERRHSFLQQLSALAR